MDLKALGLGVLAVSLVFTSCAGKSGKATETPSGTSLAPVVAEYRKISPQDAKNMMDGDTPVIVLDVRTSDEFAQGHIPNAVLIPNETITSASRPANLPDSDAVILVYCRSGNRSAQAARKLVSLGYTGIYDFGGIIDWPYEIVK